MKRLSAATILLAIMLLMFQSLASAAAPRQCTAKDTAISRFELVETLQHDGFSLPLYPQDEFKRLGQISIGKSCFVIFLFTREFRSAPGTNPHGVALLLVLRDYEYLGMYQLDNENMPTRIRGN